MRLLSYLPRLRFPVLVAVLIVMLTSCSSRPLPAAVAEAGWSDVRESNRDEVVAELARMRADAHKAEGVFVFEVDDSTQRARVTVTRVGPWTTTRLEGQLVLWEDRRTGSPERPVTVWAHDQLPGESDRDLLVCVDGSCTDVSAWYLLAAFDSLVNLPQSVYGVTSQEVYLAAAIGSLDPSVIDYYHDHIDDPVNVSVVSDAGVEHFTISDRVYVIGHRKGGTGVETCIGWFDRRDDMLVDDDRFTRFCHSSVARALTAAGDDSLLSYRPLPATTERTPKVVDDLYRHVTPEVRELLETMGFVGPAWAERHR